MTDRVNEAVQYRKKPVVIEAMQLVADPSDEFNDAINAFMAGCDWVGDRDGIDIRTLEGVMHADPGDWIIKGVKGEFYPCKPDIFAATYEPATQTAVPSVPEGMVLAPHYRGYAKLGSGGYFLYHSGKGEPAELVIVPATDSDREGRTVGDLSYDGPDEIPAEHMAVRLRFDNVAGLDALEQQLRLLRDEHFAATYEPATQPSRGVADGESVTLTVGQIAGLAAFAGLTLSSEFPLDEDERASQITVCTCPDKGVLFDGEETDAGKVAHYTHIAYCTEYPDEGCIGLGDEVSAPKDQS